MQKAQLILLSVPGSKYTFFDRNLRRFWFTRRAKSRETNLRIFCDFLHSSGQDVFRQTQVDSSATKSFVFLRQNVTIQPIKQPDVLAPPNEEFVEEDQVLIEEFVDTVHQNADWYNRKVYWGAWYQTGYFFLSIALLIVLPLAIVLLPQYVSGLPNIGSVVPAGIGDSFASNTAVVSAGGLAILSSIISVQRAFNAWFRRRRNLGQWWRARAQLIEVIRNIEIEWGRKIKAHSSGGNLWKLEAALRDALQDGLRNGRRIVSEETQVFFDNFTMPEIDVGSSLSSSGSTATGLVSLFRAPITKQQQINMERIEARTKANRNYLKSEAKVTYLQREIDDCDRKLAQLGRGPGGRLTAQEHETSVRLLARMRELQQKLDQAQEAKILSGVEREITRRG